ncbi:FAD-dependent thymidylate synthase [Candidatus Pacearchaeota archaeon]|nr:FAD-dependent thymidylate synthase [Candidatus Pacearchaeota archaeon]
MRIVKQSFELYKEFVGDHAPTEDEIVQKIGTMSRICYKSEHLAKESEKGFVNGIIKKNHNSCLEKGVITLICDIHVGRQALVEFCAIEKPFIKVDELGEKSLIITGSIRGFRELAMKHRHKTVVYEIYSYLKKNMSFFFSEIGEDDDDTQEAGCSIKAINIDHYKERTISTDIYMRHRHQGVKFITNRAVTHEMVRHRPVAFLQESQRYCSYDKDQFGNEVTFIQPLAFPKLMEEEAYQIWNETMEYCEKRYLEAVKSGMSAQAARTMLPNSCKTEINIYTDLRQWSHIFAMRSINKHAEPSMREAMIPVHESFKKMFPSCYEEVHAKVCA